jgi:hypothetical protein
VPWQPSALDFSALCCHDVQQTDTSNNKVAFITVVGTVLLHQIMIPAVYSLVLWECVTGYDIKNTVHNWQNLHIILGFQKSFFGWENSRWHHSSEHYFGFKLDDHVHISMVIMWSKNKSLFLISFQVKFSKCISTTFAPTKTQCYVKLHISVMSPRTYNVLS